MHIFTSLISASRIVIIPSDPDADSIGCALALQLWLEQQEKTAEIMSFFPLSANIKSNIDPQLLPRVQQMIQPPDLSDATVVFLDGSTWSQFFPLPEIIPSLNLNPHTTLLLDHHENGDMVSWLAEDNYMIVPQAAATAEVLFHAVLKHKIAACTAEAAQLLLTAELADTGGLSYNVNSHTMDFLSQLISLGANFMQARNYNVPFAEYEFFNWALEHTKQYPEHKLLLLPVSYKLYQKTTDEKGEAFWQNADFYKNTLGKLTAGFNHVVMLREVEPGSVKVNWRTREFGESHDLIAVFTAAGFNAGGHRNAGGGNFSGSLSAAQANLLAALAKSVPN